MLKLKSCSGELLMPSIVPTDTASYRLFLSHTHPRTHAHTPKHSCNPQLLVKTGNGVLVALSGLWGGLCKCSVVSGPNERDVCSCSLNSECCVCVCECVCGCVCVCEHARGLGKIHICCLPKYRLQSNIQSTNNQPLRWADC